MRRVAVVGLGTTPFRARWIEKTYYELALDAAKMAMEDAGIGRERIDCVVHGARVKAVFREARHGTITNAFSAH